MPQVTMGKMRLDWKECRSKEQNLSLRFVVKYSPVSPKQMNTVIENNTKCQQLLRKYENIFVLAYSSHMSVLVLSNSVWQQIINPDS